MIASLADHSSMIFIQERNKKEILLKLMRYHFAKQKGCLECKTSHIPLRTATKIKSIKQSSFQKDVFQNTAAAIQGHASKPSMQIT